MDEIESFTRASLYNICKKSPILQYVDVTNTDTETLQALVNQSFTHNVEEIMILLSKYATKLVLTFITNKYPNAASIIKPENIIIRIEDDERIQIIKSKKDSKLNDIPVYGLVVKNIILGLLNVNLENLESKLNNLSNENENSNADNQSEKPLIIPQQQNRQEISKQKEKIVNRVPVTNSILFNKNKLNDIRTVNKSRLNNYRENDRADILQTRRKIVSFADSVETINYNENIITQDNNEINTQLNTLTFNVINSKKGENFIGALQIHEPMEGIINNNKESVEITELEESVVLNENETDIDTDNEENILNVLTPPPSVSLVDDKQDDGSSDDVFKNDNSERKEDNFVESQQQPEQLNITVNDSDIENNLLTEKKVSEKENDDREEDIEKENNNNNDEEEEDDDETSDDNDEEEEIDFDLD